MVAQLFDGLVLVSLTVIIHGCILGWSLHRLPNNIRRSLDSILLSAVLLCQLAVLVIVAHMLEILLWGAYFEWKHSFPDFASAAYFSAVTYATIGYGDIVPPEEWRLIAAMEGLTGILMCAWSGGYFFAVASALFKEMREIGAQA